MKRLVQHMFLQRMSGAELCRRTGISEKTFHGWCNYTNPKITDLEACFNVLGLTLEPVRQGEQNDTARHSASQ